MNFTAFIRPNRIKLSQPASMPLASEGIDMIKPTAKKRIGKLLTPGMRHLFRTLQPLGLHVVRNHFYEPIPDTRKLGNEMWECESAMVGIDFNTEFQLELLNTLKDYISQCQFPIRPTPTPHQFHLGNDRFEALDAEILYSMIRHYKPSRIIEIGGGYSTLLSAQAVLDNEMQDGWKSELICVEPFPNEILSNGIPGLTRLIAKPVEKVNIDLFCDLQENDILFIDSSHVVKIGNDVLYEYFEILPRLRKGVFVHIHDIFLPSEYPKQWVVNEHIFWTEQYLLQAFLAFNNTFEVVWSSSYMSRRFKEKLESIFPLWQGSYQQLPDALKNCALTQDGKNVWPVSFWIRRRK